MKKLIFLLVFMLSGIALSQDNDVYLDYFLRTYPYIENNMEWQRTTRGTMQVLDANNNVLININRTFETGNTGIFEDSGPIVSARTNSTSLSFNGTFRVDTSPRSFNQTDSGTLNGLNNIGYLSMIFNPPDPQYNFEAIIYFSEKMNITAPSSTECYDIPITLTENSGPHPTQAYKWRYRGVVNGVLDNWADITPNSTFESRTKEISLEDLYPDPNDLIERLGEPIQFKVYNTLNDYDSNIVSYTWFDCPPEYNQASTTSTSCFDSNDGSVTLTFNEDIDTDNGFEMRYFIYQGNPSTFSGNIDDKIPPQAYQNVRLSSLVDNGDGTFSGSTANNLEPGPYFIVYQKVLYNGPDVTVSSGGITPANAIIISNPSAVEIDQIILTQPNCSLTTTGSAEIRAIGGGSGIYEYSKNNGLDWQTQNVFEGLEQGETYDFKVKLVLPNGTDECISATTESRTIDTVTNILSINSGSGPISPTNSNSNDGELYIRVDGGAPNFTFELYNVLNPTVLLQSATVTSAPNNEYTFYGLNEGTYFSIVKGATCAVTSTNYDLEAAPTVQLGMPTVTPISCNGASDSRITVNATYPTATTFTYELRDAPTGPANVILRGTETSLISPSSENIIISDVAPGTYWLFVKASSSDFSSIPIPEIFNPEPITAAITAVPFSCFDSTDGAITVVATGATNYEYELSTNRGRWVRLVGNSISVSDPNFYEITLRDFDNPSCVSALSNEVEVTRPLAISITEITTSHVDVSTNGGTDGSLQIEVDGGTPGYTYAWTRSETATSPRIAFAPPVGSTGNNLVNIPAGFYQVTVTDANNCTSVLDPLIEITEPGPLRILSFTGTPITCNDLNNGTLTVNIQGTLPTTYSWILEDGSPSGIEIASETNSLNSATINNLGPGTYHVIVQDADAGPLQSDSFIILNPDPITSLVTSTPSCFGANTGSITISNTIGGILAPTSNYRYSVDNGTSFQNNNTFNDLPSGFYNIVIADDNNCTYTEAVTIVTTEEIILNTENTVINNVTAQGNSDGFISVEFNGGFGQLSYEWTGPNVGGTITPEINNLISGTYSVTVTDENFCFVSEKFTITEPGPLSITLNQANNISCFGANDGSILTTVVGEAPIVYTWSETNTGVLTTTAEDDIENLPSGTYTLTVTDASTTPAVTSAEITITEPDALTGEVFPTDVSCADETDGSIIVNAIGGTPNFEYSLDNGANYQPDANINGLAAGNYTVRVRDANGCTIDLPFTINAPLALGAEIVFQSLSQAGAADGAISWVAFGGTGNLTYAWTGPNGFVSNEENNLTGLEGGNYQLTLTDENDCVFISDVIEIAEPGELLVSATQTVFLECNGDTFGEITANVQGGVTPYVFQWFEGTSGNGTELAETTPIIAELAVGTYFLLVTDANGVSRESNEINLTQPDVLEIELLETTSILCSGESTGAINISVSGGTLPYSFNWDNGAISEDLNNIPAGEYNVLVTDGNGCFTELDVIVDSAPDAVQIANFTVTNLSDYQSNDGTISIEINGGASPYAIEWIRNSDNVNLEAGTIINGLIADTYTLNVTDSNGCSITETYEVTQPDVVEETITPPTCAGESNGSISLLVNRGNGNFTYTWNTGETTNAIANLSAGSYTVTITGFGDGPLTRTYILEDPLPIEVDLGEDRTLCVGQILNLDATVDDDTAIYTWTSDTGFSSSSPLVTLTTTGNYTVTVQTASGCTAIGSIFVDISTEEIDAEFAMSSQVFVGETLIAVDISFPLPETLEWIIPENATILNQDNDEAEIIFNEAGEFEITLITTRGNCIASKTKKVIVVDVDPTVDQDIESQLEGKSVQEFLVYPNPTGGQFTVDVLLPESGNVSVKVFNFANNSLMASERARGQNEYSIPFDISGMPTGVYAIVLETPYGNTLRKIILR